MYPSGWKRQFMEACAMLFAFSYVVHLASAWLGTIVPIALVLMLLVGVFMVLFRSWRR